MRRMGGKQSESEGMHAHKNTHTLTKLMALTFLFSPEHLFSACKKNTNRAGHYLTKLLWLELNNTHKHTSGLNHEAR